MNTFSYMDSISQREKSSSTCLLRVNRNELKYNTLLQNFPLKIIFKNMNIFFIF